MDMMTNIINTRSEISHHQWYSVLNSYIGIVRLLRLLKNQEHGVWGNLLRVFVILILS